VSAFVSNVENFFKNKHIAKIFLYIQNEVSEQEVFVKISQGTLEPCKQMPEQRSTARKKIYFLFDGTLKIKQDRF
jgi:hypothetical protein